MNWEKRKDKCGFGFILTVEESSVHKIIGNLAVHAQTCVLTRMPPPPRHMDGCLVRHIY